ncbi:hypothetical protein COHA_005841 [Chlorella ohadii]|uniref:Uncharacterized protein n=1 Tax=Chlorella ohadii TaxID=2649997 RepID=A0AAD5H4Y7_9CHLO|nr:hypothetical protein COHA_005841 [Chlorella ohadii]
MAAPEEAPWRPVTLTWRVPAGLGPIGLPLQRRHRSTAAVHTAAEGSPPQPAGAEQAKDTPAQLPGRTTGERPAQQQEQPAEQVQQGEQQQAQTAGRKCQAEAQPADSSDSREARLGGCPPQAGFPAHQRVPLARDDFEADSKPEPHLLLASLAVKRQRRVPLLPVLEYPMPQRAGQLRQVRRARRARQVNRMPLQPEWEVKQGPPLQPYWEVKQEAQEAQQWEVKQEPQLQPHWELKQEPQQAHEAGVNEEPQQAWRLQHGHRGEHSESVLAGLLQFAVRQGGVTVDAGEEIVDTFIGLLPAPHQEGPRSVPFSLERGMFSELASALASAMQAALLHADRQPPPPTPEQEERARMPPPPPRVPQQERRQAPQQAQQEQQAPQQAQRVKREAPAPHLAPSQQQQQPLPRLVQLLEAALGEGAAAAPLSPSLAQAFITLLPLEAPKEDHLCSLLQRRHYSAAAAGMAAALLVEGRFPPDY